MVNVILRGVRSWENEDMANKRNEELICGFKRLRSYEQKGVNVIECEIVIELWEHIKNDRHNTQIVLVPSTLLYIAISLHPPSLSPSLPTIPFSLSH